MKGPGVKQPDVEYGEGPHVSPCASEQTPAMDEAVATLFRDDIGEQALEFLPYDLVALADSRL